MKNIKKSFLLLVALLFVVNLFACDKTNKNVVDNKQNGSQNTSSDNIIESNTEVLDEAFYKSKVESKMNELLDVAFGKRIEEITYNSIIVYLGEEAMQNESVKALGLKENEVAFEVDYSVKIAEGVSEEVFSNMNGTIEDGLIKNNKNCGVLRPNEENDYIITNYGTEF